MMNSVTELKSLNYIGMLDYESVIDDRIGFKAVNAKYMNFTSDMIDETHSRTYIHPIYDLSKKRYYYHFTIYKRGNGFIACGQDYFNDKFVKIELTLDEINDRFLRVDRGIATIKLNKGRLFHDSYGSIGNLCLM